MDIYIEHLVKKKPDLIDKVTIAVIIFFSVILTALCLFLGIIGLGGLVLIAIAGIAWGAYFLITSRNLEFEYSITNGEIDIDRIVNKRGRRRIITIKPTEIEVLAPKSHEGFNREFENYDVTKIKACSSVDSEKLYYLILNREHRRLMLLFEPTEKMIEAIKKYTRKVFD